MSFDPIQLPEPIFITSVPTQVIFIVQVLIAVSMLITFIRIIKGPEIADRIVALDLFAALIIVQCILLVITSGFIGFLDVSSAIAIIAFLATVAFSKYLQQHLKK